MVPDDPGLAARAPGVNRAVELLDRSDAGQLRSGGGGLDLQRPGIGAVGRHPDGRRMRAQRGRTAGVPALRRARVACPTDRLALRRYHQQSQTAGSVTIGRHAWEAMSTPQFLLALGGATALLALCAAIFPTRAHMSARPARSVAKRR